MSTRSTVILTLFILVISLVITLAEVDGPRVFNPSLAAALVRPSLAARGRRNLQHYIAFLNLGELRP